MLVLMIQLADWQTYLAVQAGAADADRFALRPDCGEPADLFRPAFVAI